MAQKYTNLDRAMLIGGLGLVTGATYLAIQSLRNTAGSSYLSVWPLGGYEVVLGFLLAFIVASIDVYRDMESAK